jgi:hypothetical protein
MALELRSDCRSSLRSLAVSLAALLGLSTLGCEQTEIKKYTAEKEKTALETSRLAGYDVPKGWQRQEKAKELSVITFTVGEPAENVYLTVSRFPGAAGGVFANVTRWRKKVGLSDATKEEIEKDVKKLTADGETVQTVDLAKEASGNGPRILGAICLPKHSSVTWIFMMHGPAEAVGKHKAEFEAFVQSVKFGMGAYDG